MKLSHKLIMVSAAALMSVSPLLNTTQNVNAATASTKKTTTKKTSSKKTTTKKSASTKKTTSTKKSTSKKTTKKAASSKTTTSKKTTSNTIKLTHNAYVYDKNGKRLKTYMGSAKYTTIAKGVTVNSNGTKTIKGVLYYSLGGGAYIKAANVDGKVATSSSTKKTSSKNTSSNKPSTDESEDSTSTKLIHNAYVYDVNGKRIKKYEGKSKLTKGTEIDTYGTVNIKGKKYYQLDEEGTAFVKAGNVDRPTTITLKKNAYIYNGEGKTKKKLVKKGKTVKTTEARYIGTKLYYKIGDDQFVKAANVGKVKGEELDPINEPDGAATVEVPDTEDVNSTKVITKGVVSLYDIKGQKYANRIFDAGVSQQVSELRYIATSVNSTPQLFYKLASGRGYLKADEVTVDGKILNAVNTPEQAKADVTVATTADKAKLTQSINEAASVKASEIYKLSSSTAKAAYDKAITDGAIVNNNASATIGQVNEAESAITSAKAKLNGAKIAVANLNSLTPDEVTAIVKAVANANNVPESAIQFSNNNTTLSIVTNGYTQSLNINDYAVQNSAINR
ncbi:SLAP domain-containing protein [Lactobacillus gallinarum]|uniref:SLAP domain-containing protein n=1 Tax=Lactobacillus gallinarum TaxID=52242 RepID=UPI000B364F81|nr:SLAP domain-containing protein [Lactobacillus gallinarum]OUQ00769.1 cell division protein [Lactobacillus gallinarum]OUQ47290.1 cell division protein [Lactobacillus gallinarum]